MTFKIASSPHNHSQKKTSVLMRSVILACIPGILAQWYFFGYGNIIHILLACVTALLCEAMVLALRHKPIRRSLADNSALLTAVLLGICLPPLAPWWVTILGSAFAIVIVKQLYGGLGSNPFNPAMAGYVMLLVSFPLQMTMWIPPVELQAMQLSFFDSLSVIFSGFSGEGYSVNQLRMDIDGITMATPLDTLKTDVMRGITTTESLTKSIFSQYGGIGWEYINLGFLLGGLYLLQIRAIKWQIPAATLLSLALFSTIGMLANPDQVATPLLHLISGGTMLGAFFIATDPVSAATTDKGRLYYGFLIGALVYIIRTWGGYPDAIAFAVLLANMGVPLIDQLTQPKVYGHQASKSNAKDKQEAGK
ncbi:MAG: electron transport complex protein RnfD [Phenylobacterium sp.]|jgi:electron transport complex protein RnfD